MKLTGAQIIVETLIEQGVTDVFGYPGGQVVNIYDALYEYSDRINHYLTAHEQGAAHAADGYARATGKTGVVIATSGPGATNLVTGIATAHLDSVPMVAITGNVPCNLIGKDSFQEIDITCITLPITKHNYFVNDVEELADSIREAFRIARSGRPGPVLIDVPKDIQMAECEFERKPVEPCFEVNKLDTDKIKEAAALIRSSKRPYIYIGGGVLRSDAEALVLELSEKADAFIGSSLMGLSAIPSDNERFLGMQGMHGRYASSMAQKEADLIIAVGVRFSDRATGNKAKYVHGARIIQLDVDFSEFNKNVDVDVAINADLKESLCALINQCEQKDNADWRNRIKELREKEKSLEKKFDRLTPKAILDIMNENTEDDTVIATDVGQHQMWTAQEYRFRKPRTLVSSGGLGTMGFGLGAAIGANVGTGNRVVLVTGDGSFGMNLNELATAVTYNIPITVVLLDNGVLGMVRQWQTLFFDKHYSSTTLKRKTDFSLLAKAFGAKGVAVDSEEAFREAFKASMAESGPFVIDCKIDCDEFVLPMLPPGGSVDDMIVE
ncbi:MAG: biosynthetic-type acetolactate synthase large subunit [Clostridia bacterium]|nr:biosynthetic-type acetolactate synthase large subunit [Clostridia bacterium]